MGFMGFLVSVGIWFVFTAVSYGQVDPGLRGGAPGAGGPIHGLNATESADFSQFKATFEEIDDVAAGLGPRMNLDGCAQCHAHPAIGGSSPPRDNPQVVRAGIFAPGNKIPQFLSINGPIRELHTLSAGGGVVQIFTITGRPDNPPGCAISQPDFSDPSDLRLRIGTPLFGAGLIEEISHGTLQSNLSATDNDKKRNLGIFGKLNGKGKFGWKAQQDTLTNFAAEAYLKEQGVTSTLQPVETERDPLCDVHKSPEDVDGDVRQFARFMQLLDQPTPSCGVAGQPACSASINNGRAAFSSVGCVLCHTASLRTGVSKTNALTNVNANLFSDLAVHDMGTGLNDDITQGSASGREFRTAPLWGLGQRGFFLHDGRCQDLGCAISAHDSAGSEASEVIQNYRSLPTDVQQSILDFLRTL